MARFTDEQISDIRQMVETGSMTYGEIGFNLRVSRSVIAGICFRNGIRAPGGKRPPPKPRAWPRAKPHLIRPAREALLAPAPAQLPIPPTPSPAPEIKPCSLLDLKPHSCRWPLWGRNEKSGDYCGAHAATGSSYCANHRAISRGEGTPSERNAIAAAKHLV